MNQLKHIKGIEFPVIRRYAPHLSSLPSLKNLLIMKLFIVLLLATGLQVTAKPSDAQDVTISGSNMPLRQVFSEIRKQTDCQFFYNDELLQSARPVSIHVQNAPVTYVLDLCFKNQPLTYMVVGKTIVVKHKKEMQVLGISTLQPTPPPPPDTIKGHVTDAQGNPLVGVTVKVKDGSQGTVTDGNGVFALKVGDNAVLEVSYIGFETQDIPTNGQSNLDIQMRASLAGLNEIVVTALGIEKSSKGLTYATQNISSKELTQVKSVNFMNSLAGKAAGVVITQGNAGPGSSARVLLRGNKSITGNNQPLYVIDGIPMNNNAAHTSGNSLFGTQDYGDAISNLNQDDIESIEILKGASAAALYGSQAANGVILVTTKKGRKSDTRIDFTSTLTLQTPIGLPENQSTYGQSEPGSNESWGEKISGAKNDNHIKNFFNTGTNFLNSISVSSGNDVGQVYVSYANTKATGIVPENTLNKHNFYLRGTSQLFQGKLSLDASVNYIHQMVHNRPQSGYYLSPLFSLYTFPTGDDFSKYSGSHYETWDPVRLLYAQNWPYIVNEASSSQNPYWIQHRNQNDLFRERSIFSFSAKYNLTDWLNVQGRLNYDRVQDIYEQRLSATTDPIMASPNGGYTKNNTNNNQLYGDLMVSGNKTFNALSLSATVGYSITRDRNYGTSLSSVTASGLAYPNFFSAAGLKFPFNASEDLTRAMSQAVFATATLGYKDRLFLDLTGRNEWSTTVSQTFFYPSVGLSYILIDGSNTNSSILSFAKIRGSFAEVGNALPFGIANRTPSYSLSVDDNVNPRGTLPYFSGSDTVNLKPERTRSYEAGAELRFFEDKLSLNLTYYNATTGNQVFTIGAPAGSGASNFYINGGTIRNKGIEGVISYQSNLGKVQWTSAINFSHNKNQIIQLSDLLTTPRFVLTDINSTRQVQLFLTRPDKGHYGSYGDLFGKKIQRNKDGSIVVDDAGLPVLSTNPDEYIGNANPKFLAGFNNSFSYKGLTLHFLVDGRFGGKIVSVTESWRDWKGLTKRTAEARDNGGVEVNGQMVDAEAYYKRVSGSGQQGAAELYAYDATNVRLRELSLTYAFPSFSRVIKNLSLSLVGRNLFFFYKKAPFDPEVSIAPSNGLQGIEAFNMPSTRSYGFTLTASF